jgi:exodeoxyribonuclease VII large subunit
MPYGSSPRVYTVSDLTEDIRSLLESRFEFIWVEGELSNVTAPVSGHYYMVLKDDKAQIRGVMFRIQARYLKFRPEDGMRVIAQGRIGVYPPRGEYQIILDYLEPMGVGALAMAFEQLKKKLAAEGLFSEELKKPLPFLPQRVAIITSPTGAAVRDFLKIVRKRFVNMEIVVVPVRVQGEGAASDIIKALEQVNRELNVDVIVLTRGGGSIEDLWAFNEESLAYAIRNSRIPVVSAVGHEVDVTIADLVSDLRAPTPSAAAEMLVAEKESLAKGLLETFNRLVAAMRFTLRGLARDLGQAGKRLADPRKKMADHWLRLDDMQLRLARGVNHILREKGKTLGAEKRALRYHDPMKTIRSLRERVQFRESALAGAVQRRVRENRVCLSNLDDRLRALSPFSILSRGYSITRLLPGMTLLRNASEANVGGRVQIRLAEGELECKVEKTKPGKTEV